MMARTFLSAVCFLIASAGAVIAAEPLAADPTAAAGAPGADASSVPAGAIVVTGTNSPGDAARINAAIAASPEGAEVTIRGACLIDEPIRLLGNRSYRGESRTGTVLKQADGANLVALMASSVFLDNKAWTGSPVAIRHLQLDGNRQGNPKSATAGLVLRSWLSVVEDIHIRDMGSDGLRLTNLSADGTGLKTTQVNGRIANCFIERAGRHGIFVEDTQNAVTDWILTDNWIASSGVDGIHMDNAAGWFVQRNHVYGVPQHAILARRAFATSICDNYIEGFGESEEAGQWCGIYATLQGGIGSTIANNRIFNFGGETQKQSQYRYLAVTANYGTAMVVVANNVIRGGGTPRGTAMHYRASGDRKLLLTSNDNAAADVAEPRMLEGNVVLQPGL
ncbi:MAG: right-handed parallel beta-helix repeat-containing protein [Rhodopirellula sp.]|nr:right-handed parallel beta-helix repeat-containing protein [Rhodopirellula sp.]